MRDANEPPEESAPERAPERLLRAGHRLALALLAVCALVIAAGAGGPQNGTPARGYTVAAVALAALSIASRWLGNAPRTPVRTAVGAHLAALGLAAGIGVVGLLLAIGEGLWRTGLFYTLAGGLLAIRQPSLAAPADAAPTPAETAASKPEREG